MKKSAIGLMACISIACGGPDRPEPTTGSAQRDVCAGHVRDEAACMSDAAFEQCREREAQCPGQVLVLESCPLQFACP